ncbi:uncharacterized protein LOC135927907 isoform X2 [Gordionus sp. m RMFG-2023]|uniref:uncharacterized protein LOC135927907 isoform X2 n=1 Tax=Gordionus sp. m RMFG-2023 TaxID=3053472 RepID=UPI0031FCAEFE
MKRVTFKTDRNSFAETIVDDCENSDNKPIMASCPYCQHSIDALLLKSRIRVSTIKDPFRTKFAAVTPNNIYRQPLSSTPHQKYFTDCFNNYHNPKSKPRLTINNTINSTCNRIIPNYDNNTKKISTQLNCSDIKTYPFNYTPTTLANNTHNLVNYFNNHHKEVSSNGYKLKSQLKKSDINNLSKNLVTPLSYQQDKRNKFSNYKDIIICKKPNYNNPSNNHSLDSHNHITKLRFMEDSSTNAQNISLPEEQYIRFPFNQENGGPGSENPFSPRRALFLEAQPIVEAYKRGFPPAQPPPSVCINVGDDANLSAAILSNSLKQLPPLSPQSKPSHKEITGKDETKKPAITPSSAHSVTSPSANTHPLSQSSSPRKNQSVVGNGTAGKMGDSLNKRVTAQTIMVPSGDPKAISPVVQTVLLSKKGKIVVENGDGIGKTKTKSSVDGAEKSDKVKKCCLIL